MKVWQIIAGDKVGWGREWVKFQNNTHCPATIEHKSNLIGEKKMERFCDLGCSVICTDEYLDLEIKGAKL